MESSVFDFDDYRLYLVSRLGDAGKRTGLRSQACGAVGCHSTYLSQVLSGKTELSLEYAEAFNKFFHHGPEEGNFFLLLLLKARAGSQALRERFQAQIDSVRKTRAAVRGRLKDADEVSAADQDRFYSSWLYGALHVLASLPQMKTKTQLAASLGVSETKVAEAVEFLSRIGVLVGNKGGLQVGPRHVHLNSDSRLITRHHINWRFHAIQSLEAASAEDLHYSGTISLSKTAAQQIRANLVKAFKENMALMRDSKEEVAYVYNYDFYRLDR